MTPEEIKDKYGERIMALLNDIKRRLTRIAFTAEGPGAETMTDADTMAEEYIWSLELHPPIRPEGEQDDVWVRFRIVESENEEGRKGDVNLVLEASARSGTGLVDIPSKYGKEFWVRRNDPEAVEKRFLLVEGSAAEAAEAIAKATPMGPKEWRPEGRRGPEMGARRKMSREEVAAKYDGHILGVMRKLAGTLRKRGLHVEDPYEMHDQDTFQWWMVASVRPAAQAGEHKGEDIDIVARITSELEGDVFFVYDISTVDGTPLASVDSEPASLRDPQEIEEQISYLGSPGAITEASKAILEYARGTAKKGPKEWSPRWSEE